MGRQSYVTWLDSGNNRIEKNIPVLRICNIFLWIQDNNCKISVVPSSMPLQAINCTVAKIRSYMIWKFTTFNLRG